MESDAAGMEPELMGNLVVAGSVVAGIGIFLLGMIVMLVIGFFVGALALTEKLAVQCSNDSEGCYAGGADGGVRQYGSRSDEVDAGAALLPTMAGREC